MQDRYPEFQAQAACGFQWKDKKGPGSSFPKLKSSTFSSQNGDLSHAN